MELVSDIFYSSVPVPVQVLLLSTLKTKTLGKTTTKMVKAKLLTLLTLSCVVTVSSFASSLARLSLLHRPAHLSRRCQSRSHSSQFSQLLVRFALPSRTDPRVLLRACAPLRMAAGPEGGYYSMDEIEAAARSAGECFALPLCACIDSVPGISLR